ncbi:hypothetical protein NDU88_001838 [Pleurodeles waltl]|uniref:Uncharacterized protein n=1 Tax=Pleurodeles waltl TaxID=8319 RepID=A0AAV7KRA9_PLEWA|nr:hypothetical protein NDU88_001838 [Pleurodeles waltl]
MRGGPGEGRAGGGGDWRSSGPACPCPPLPRALGVPVTGGPLALGRAGPGRPLERPAGVGARPGPPEDRLSRERLAGLGWSWGPIGSPPSPEEAWEWIEERPRLGSGKSKELEKSPRTAAGARPKEWSLQLRRGRRRLRTGRSTPWRIPRHTDMRVDTTDSEGGRSVRDQPRRGQEGKSPQMSENGGGRGGGSPNPLLEAIDRMEVEQEARTQPSPDG